jgi:hypothetical protein
MSNSITEFFEADPLSLSRSDFEAIIEHYRSNRANFQLAGKVSLTTASQKKTAAALEKAKNLSIDLDDIEI